MTPQAVSSSEIDTTVVLETFNYLEGTPIEAVHAALTAAIGFAAPPGAVEVLLADVTRDPAIARMLAAEFPSVRRLDAFAMGYDEAKALAAREARGRIIVYLDCDCVPDDGWFDRITAPLRDGRAAATGGFARYPGGFFSTLYSIMDFGFLLPRREHALGCYASNNSAFMREVLLRIPEPDGPMRCRCYPHAQQLARRGYPVMLAPGASVRHLPPPFLRERIRQGYDMVAACWVDAELPEARILRYGIAAAPAFFWRRIRLDFETIHRHGKEMGLSRIQRALARPILIAARILDLAGIVAALAIGPRARKLVEAQGTVSG
jgi:hypothetical protein